MAFAGINYLAVVVAAVIAYGVTLAILTALTAA